MMRNMVEALGGGISDGSPIQSPFMLHRRRGNELSSLQRRLVQHAACSLQKTWLSASHMRMAYPLLAADENYDRQVQVPRQF